MELSYLDTSALMRWVERDVKNPTGRNQSQGALVESLIANRGIRLALSALTLIEFRVSVSRNWRSIQSQHAEFDASWAEAARRGLMEQLANGRVDIVQTPRQVSDHAIALVDMAARDHRFAASAWDTIHLLTAADWAYREGAVVRLYTSDGDYGDFVALYPHFQRFVEIMDLKALTTTS